MEQTQNVKLPLRRRLPFWARLLLQLASFGVCVALMACLLGTAVIADMRIAFSGDNLKNLLSTVIHSETPQSAPVQRPQAKSGVVSVEDALPLLPYEYDEVGDIAGFTDQNGDFVPLPEEIFFHEDAEGLVHIGYNQLTDIPIYVHPVVEENGNVSGFISREGQVVEVLIHLGSDEGEEASDALVDWAYRIAIKLLGEESGITKDDLREFIRVSTVSDFLVDKVGDAAEKFLQDGTLGPVITADDLAALMQENKDLVQEHFGVELTPEKNEQLKDMLEQIVEEEGLNEMLQEMVDDILASEEPVTIGPVSFDKTPAQLLDNLRAILSGSTLLILLLICLALAAVLCGLNFYNIPAGLTWISAACLVSGGLLSLVLMLVDSLANTMEKGGLLVQTIAQSFGPVHYGIFWTGVALLAGSIVWRVLRGIWVRKHTVPAI